MFTLTLHTEAVKGNLVKCEPGCTMLLQLPRAVEMTSELLDVTQEPSMSWPMPLSPDFPYHSLPWTFSPATLNCL